MTPLEILVVETRDGSFYARVRWTEDGRRRTGYARCALTAAHAAANAVTFQITDGLWDIPPISGNAWR